MTIHTLVQEQLLPITMHEAWEFFSATSNLDAITPPGLRAQETRMDFWLSEANPQ
jgi:uncharacterized protein YccT (UPF0319 family)